MIIPSVDIMKGNAVQLRGGEELLINGGDPEKWAGRFSLSGELAVIDLDAALGQGSNREIISKLVRKYRCRVGGGIRDLETALYWLDNGAEKIIVGTKAEPDFLQELPRDRIMAAVDARNGEIVVKGWRENTGKDLLSGIEKLKPFVSGFLVTFVESEGQMKGIDMEKVKSVVEAARPCRVTVAGGVTTAAEIKEIDQLGADCQVGMALYSGRLQLSEAIAAPLASDRPDGLWPTVVTDESGKALGLVYSNLESLSASVETGKGVYFSRKRGLWEKGKESGNTQELIAVDLDCDRDCLRFRVRQKGSGFCHRQTSTCFPDVFSFSDLWIRLGEKGRSGADNGSYTARLFRDKNLLNSKLCEEALEVTKARNREELIYELSDLLYFTFVKMAGADIRPGEIVKELSARTMKVRRRGGEAKERRSGMENIRRIPAEEALSTGRLRFSEKAFKAAAGNN